MQEIRELERNFKKKNLLLNPSLCLLNLFHSFISEAWLQFHTEQTSVQNNNEEDPLSFLHLLPRSPALHFLPQQAAQQCHSAKKSSIGLQALQSLIQFSNSLPECDYSLGAFFPFGKVVIPPTFQEEPVSRRAGLCKCQWRKQKTSKEQWFEVLLFQL